MLKAVILLALILVINVPTYAAGLQLEMGGNRPNTADKTCLVDGDTLWLDGENIRLRDFDTPEPQTQICGGDAEVALAHRASARMLDLLNGKTGRSSASVTTAPAANAGWLRSESMVLMSATS